MGSLSYLAFLLSEYRFNLNRDIRFEGSIPRFLWRFTGKLVFLKDLSLLASPKMGFPVTEVDNSREKAPFGGSTYVAN